MTRCKQLRQERGETQQEVANLLGISRGAYANIENGKRKPDFETIFALADHFEVSVDYLLARDSPRRSVPEGLVNGSPELTEYLDYLAARPEMRMLFHVTKDATKEQVEAIVKMIESISGQQG